MSSRWLKLFPGGEFGVGEEVAVDDVGESSFEGAHGASMRVLPSFIRRSRNSLAGG